MEDSQSDSHCGHLDCRGPLGRYLRIHRRAGTHSGYAARGYFAFGGEWLIVLGVTLLAFHVINNAFFGMLKHH